MWRDLPEDIDPYGGHRWGTIDAADRERWIRERAAVVLPSIDIDRAAAVLTAIMDSTADIIDVFVALARDAGSMVDVRDIREALFPDREHGQIPNVDAVSTVTVGRRTERGRPVVVGSDAPWNASQSVRDASHRADRSDHLRDAADDHLRSFDALDGSTRLMGGEHLAFPEVIHAGTDAALPGVTSRHALINDALAAVRDPDVRDLLRNEHRAVWDEQSMSWDVDRGAPRATHHRRLVRVPDRVDLRKVTPRNDERLGPVSVVPRFVRDRDTGRLVIRDRVTRGQHRRTFIVDVDGSTVSHVDALTIDARSTRSGTIDRGRDVFVHGHGSWVPRPGTVAASRGRRSPRPTFTTSTDRLASMARERAAGLAPGESVAVTDGTSTVTISRPASITAPFTVSLKVDGRKVDQSRTRRPSSVATAVERHLATR